MSKIVPQYVGFLVLRDGFFETTSKILIISLIENFVLENEVALKFSLRWNLVKFEGGRSFWDATLSTSHVLEKTGPLLKLCLT